MINCIRLCLMLCLFRPNLPVKLTGCLLNMQGRRRGCGATPGVGSSRRGGQVGLLDIRQRALSVYVTK